MAEDQDLEQLEARLAALGTNVQEAIDEPGEDAERFRSIKKRVADIRTDIEELKASRLEPAVSTQENEAGLPLTLTVLGGRQQQRGCYQRQHRPRTAECS